MKKHHEDPLEITYRFDFEGKRENIDYTVRINRTSLVAYPPEGSMEHEWTLLDFNKCSICPLSSSEVKHCPIAFNLSGLAEIFSEIISYDQAIITVTTEERTYIKRTDMQQGARSIMGIYMASSGCPHMAILKPMVRFHLPFASTEESLYRHVTSYLLSQYFEYLDGKQPDLNLEKLEMEHDNVDLVNRGILKRFWHISNKDLNRNAIIILNTLGVILKQNIKGKLKKLKYLYSP
jgi:hypothetical protein